MKFKKKKVHKMRASTYHGYGKGASHHKGSGNRGGKGRAGSGKKCDGKKPSFWKEPQGRHGFTSKSRFSVNAINISQVEKMLSQLESTGTAIKKGAGFAVDLTKTSFNKLLSSGIPSVALHIKVDYASKNASAKLAESGGSLEVVKVKAKKEKKKPVHKKKAEESGDSASEE